MSAASGEKRASDAGSRSSTVRSAIVILASALVLRLILAITLPCVSRDGAAFCTYAQQLRAQGVGYLQTPDAVQHPLFPTLIGASFAALRSCGAPATPTVWIVAGQIITLASGLGVILLTGALCRLVAERCSGAVRLSVARNFGWLLAGFLPLNVWHSADVMADELHLCFYLGAVLCFARSSARRAALGAGILAGLAFLTRQEGALVALVAVVFLIAHCRRDGARRVVARVVLVLVGFALLAGPYWWLTGSFSNKKDPLELLLGSVTAPPATVSVASSELVSAPVAARRGPIAARLERQDPGWLMLAPTVVHELFRAGRIVIPLLAFVGLVMIGRRLGDSHNRFLMMLLVSHVAVLALLLKREGYLAQRHLLPVLSLLMPYAVLALVGVMDRLRARRHSAGAMVVLAVVFLPLLLYSLRQPNHADRFLVDAARRLREFDPTIAGRRIMSGSSARRVAFYCDAVWLSWPEQPEFAHRLVTMLQEQRPAYFLIELGDGFETEGNRKLVGKLETSGIAETLERVLEQPRPQGGVLRAYRLNWQGR